MGDKAIVRGLEACSFGFSGKWTTVVQCLIRSFDKKKLLLMGISSG
jgi:hypothetical protein